MTVTEDLSERLLQLLYGCLIMSVARLIKPGCWGRTCLPFCRTVKANLRWREVKSRDRGQSSRAKKKCDVRVRIQVVGFKQNKPE